MKITAILSGLVLAIVAVSSAGASSPVGRTMSTREQLAIRGGGTETDRCCTNVLGCFGTSVLCNYKTTLATCTGKQDFYAYHQGQECVKGKLKTPGAACTDTSPTVTVCHDTFTCVWDPVFQLCVAGSFVSNVSAPPSCTDSNPPC